MDGRGAEAHGRGGGPGRGGGVDAGDLQPQEATAPLDMTGHANAGLSHPPWYTWLLVFFSI